MTKEVQTTLFVPPCYDERTTTTILFRRSFEDANS